MPDVSPEPHPLALHRKKRGWSQEQLAAASGVPRSSVSAIEAGRLTPSVSAALAVAKALECSVEELFGGVGEASGAVEWGWAPRSQTQRYWEAEVGGRRLLYPAEAQMNGAGVHDGVWHAGVLRGSESPPAARTLVLAGCDPAAGLLVQEYATVSDFRMICFSRGGAAALELLRRGLVHVAALHRSTSDHPERNAETVRAVLGGGYRLLRAADWQEGVVLGEGLAARSVHACAKGVRRWAVREPGSSARECLEELLGAPRSARHPLASHAAVAEAVRAGWAEAGVCVRLCAEEAGLRFLPVRTEALDFCFAASFERDPRLQALIRLLRSRAYRSLIDDLPGYDARHSGELREV